MFDNFFKNTQVSTNSRSGISVQIVNDVKVEDSGSVLKISYKKPRTVFVNGKQIN